METFGFMPKNECARFYVTIIPVFRHFTGNICLTRYKLAGVNSTLICEDIFARPRYKIARFSVAKRILDNMKYMLLYTGIYSYSRCTTLSCRLSTPRKLFISSRKVALTVSPTGREWLKQMAENAVAPLLNCKRRCFPCSNFC